MLIAIGINSGHSSSGLTRSSRHRSSPTAKRLNSHFANALPMPTTPLPALMTVTDIHYDADEPSHVVAWNGERVSSAAAVAFVPFRIRPFVLCFVLF
jgi:hypothetical protein